MGATPIRPSTFVVFVVISPRVYVNRSMNEAEDEAFCNTVYNKVYGHVLFVNCNTIRWECRREWGLLIADAHKTSNMTETTVSYSEGRGGMREVSIHSETELIRYTYVCVLPCYASM